MLPHEIGYGALMDRAIRDFKPVKRLWSVSTRLFFWILFETAILVGTAAFLGHHHLPVMSDPARFLLTLGLPIFASVAAAFLALKGAVPGREVPRSELVLLIVLVAAVLAISSGSSVGLSGLAEVGISVAGFIGVAALPWSVLFWAVRRGVPLQPAKAGITIGLAAFSYALAVIRFIDYESGPANQLSWLASSAILLMLPSAVAGIYGWIG